MNAIEVNRLRKTYPGGVEAVRDIDFEVAPGEVFGLLGPNGAGKSTTIGMLTPTIAPTAGTARLAGFDVASEPLAAPSVASGAFRAAVVDRPRTGRPHPELHARLRRPEAAPAELAALRAGPLAGDGAFTVGPTLTVPLHERSGVEAMAAIHELGVRAPVSTRQPTLDDVYLRLTGDRLAAAA